MERTRLLLPFIVAVAVIAAVLEFPSHVHAHAISLDAPVMRSGTQVGTARGTLIVSGNGWAVDNVRVVGFRAPSANGSWRARTTLATSCTEPGFDPAEDDPDDFETTAVRVHAPWRTTRISGTTGRLTTRDFVEECPAGQVPGSSLMLTLLVQNAAGTTRVGFANLFSAG